MKKSKNPKEKFVPVFGHEGIYEVSNTGKVLSLRTNRLMGQHIDKNGRYYVSLTNKNKISRHHALHRLILKSFTGVDHKNLHAAHKDGCHTNNNLSNLYWATPKQNQQDRVKHGTMLFGEKNKNSKLKEKDVLYILNNYKKTSARKSNIKVLAKIIGVGYHCIYWVIHGHSWNQVTGLPKRR